MAIFKLLFYTPFLWLSIAFAEYPIDIKGVWERTCVKETFFSGTPQEIHRYETIQLAFFDENILVQSWQVYNDSDCQKLNQRNWSKWEVVFESTEADEQVSLMPTVGSGVRQCKKALDIFKLTADNEFYWGKKTDCNTRPVELEESPFTFSRPLSQTLENYMKTLSRYEVVREGSKIRMVPILQIGETEAQDQIEFYLFMAEEEGWKAGENMSKHFGRWLSRYSVDKDGNLTLKSE